MRRPSWVSSEVDLTRPSAARVYDFYLGGSHNLEIDRRMARDAISLWPVACGSLAPIVSRTTPPRI